MGCNAFNLEMEGGSDAGYIWGLLGLSPQSQVSLTLDGIFGEASMALSLAGSSVPSSNVDDGVGKCSFEQSSDQKDSHRRLGIGKEITYR